MNKGGSLMREDKRVALSRLEWEGFTKRIKIDKIIKSESYQKAQKQSKFGEMIIIS